MITDVKNYPISVLFDTNSTVIYTIPRYQREYSWSKLNWDAIFDDILESESSYFLGSIICINQSRDALGIQELELVDGQQRMITLSLLFLAFYATLKKYDKNLEEDQKAEIVNLKNRLIVKKTDHIRVNPQIQNFNKEDYHSLLVEEKLMKNGYSKPQKIGTRKIFKCYNHFKKKIENYFIEKKERLDALFNLLDKFLKTSLVKIEVESYADAYTLFESLNNRGTPLTPIDLIKNKLLSELENKNSESIEHNFNNWQILLEYLGDDYIVQERFFRQYYNAFKTDFSQTTEVSIATKSNIFLTYEKLIKKDPQSFIDKLTEAGKLYSFILGYNKDENLNEEFSSLNTHFKNLEHVQGTPSYLMLLNLMVYRKEYNLKQDQFVQIITRLVSFFVRRNVTDAPPTRDLNPFFMKIVDYIREMKKSKNTALVGNNIVTYIFNELSEVSSSDKFFKEKLSGPIYEENAGATRFILCSLEEKFMTKENRRNLWEEKNKQFIWTIEHILPQSENLPKLWVDMIAKGDKEKAKSYQETYTHQLGNLTISGFNSSLSNKSFQEKRDREDRQGVPVGYKNGLKLNEDLATAQTWTIDQIKKRTEKLVDQVLDLFMLK